MGPNTDFGTGGKPFSVAVGDFNGDGKLDLAVANSGFGANTVSILLGTGTGSFGAKTDFGTGLGPSSVAVGDFNGDGKLDLAVTNFDSDTVSILPGTGTGAFGAKTDFGTGDRPNSVAVGDFNGDGKLDLAVANLFDDTVSILLNNCSSNNPSNSPSITDVAYDGRKKVKITGSKFGSAPRVLINGNDRSDFIVSVSDDAIQLKGKAKKLGIKSGDNSVQVIDAAGSESNVFTLTN